MDWHRRYLHQAAWTGELRRYLLDKAGLASARRILEVGCGTGAILSRLSADSSQHRSIGQSICGLDISREALVECRVHAPSALLSRADAHHLPYTEQVFDITFCHFLLLWLKAPGDALLEMKRVTRRGGNMLILAEPDYTARLDKPKELEMLGSLQTLSLQRQGADVGIGARIAGLCERAGIRVVESGMINRREQDSISQEEEEVERDVLRADLEGLVSAHEIDGMQLLDAEARRRGVRVLYVPTYYVWGQV